MGCSFPEVFCSQWIADSIFLLGPGGKKGFSRGDFAGAEDESQAEEGKGREGKVIGDDVKKGMVENNFHFRYGAGINGEGAKGGEGINPSKRASGVWDSENECAIGLK